MFLRIGGNNEQITKINCEEYVFRGYTMSLKALRRCLLDICYRHDTLELEIPKLDIYSYNKTGKFCEECDFVDKVITIFDGLTKEI